MKYAMSINYVPGHTDALSEDERKAMIAEYMAIEMTPGISPAASCSRSRPPPPCACRTARR